MGYTSKRTGLEIDTLLDFVELIKDKGEGEGNEGNIGNYFPKMTVGFAENLVGRGEATQETFTRRVAAARQSIENDIARIKCIKGNSLVWNQWIPRGGEIEGEETEWYGENGDLSHNGNEYEISNDGMGGNPTIISPSYEFLPKAGHKLLLLVDAYFEDVYRIYANVFGITVFVDCERNYIMQQLGFFVDTPNTLSSQKISIWGDSTMYYLKVKDNISLIDLTQMFGRGNEPANLVEFNAKMPINIDSYVQDLGRIVSMNVDAITTIGLNQWDGEIDFGSYDEFDGIPIERDGYVRNAFSIPAFENTTYCFTNDKETYFSVFFYDENLDCIESSAVASNECLVTPSMCRYINFAVEANYKGNICISIAHTGINNGKYAPYTQNTLDLSMIREYFPDGMRSVGDVRDEIRYNEYDERWEAITRVRQRDYYSNDENESNVVTDGMNYTLEIMDAPSVAIIPANKINFNYYVEDFGVEDASSDDISAPFCAEIIYTFNAVDTIRNNRLRIEALEHAIAQIQASISIIKN